MNKGIHWLKRSAILLLVLTIIGLVVDYLLYPDNYPNAFTLTPLCFFIVNLLVIALVAIYYKMTRGMEKTQK